jgi:hypothetical protein
MVTSESDKGEAVEGYGIGLQPFWCLIVQSVFPTLKFDFELA